MRRRLRTTAVAACVFTSMLGAATAESATAAEPDQSRRWLALGDSYSSGEGIQDTPTPSAAQRPRRGEEVRDCRRATGEGDRVPAWAPGAYVQVGDDLGIGEQAFVACTGAISDEVKDVPPLRDDPRTTPYPGQIGEAETRWGEEKWDLVTFSMGGNNIKFADIIRACIVPRAAHDLPWQEYLRVEVGCPITPEQLSARIKMLVGKQPIDTDEYEGKTTLPEMYDTVAEHVRPGGDVVVVGYPNIIEEAGAGRWQNRPWCQGIWRKDVELLRNGLNELNTAIRSAVENADRKHRSKGIRFHFVDISHDPYEASDNASDRHALCTDDPWLHTFEPEVSVNAPHFYKDKSFHPNKGGWFATANRVADYLREHVRFDDGPLACGTVFDQATGRAATIAIEQGDVPCEEARHVLSTFFETFRPKDRTRAGAAPHVTGDWYCSDTPGRNGVVCHNSERGAGAKQFLGAWPADQKQRGCPDVGFKPNSGDGAFEIVSSGVPCEEVEYLLREVHAGGGFTARFSVGDFDCRRTQTTSGSLPERRYRCTADHGAFTFTRA